MLFPGHHTRGKRGILWPRATEFLASLPSCSVIADIGCGDGKYFAASWSSGHYVIGSDMSLELLRCTLNGTGGGKDARQKAFDDSGDSRRPEVFGGDILNIALRDGSVDAVICIAVLHHISTRERRIRCLQELCRIVKVGGKVDVQAWALEQDPKSKRQFKNQDLHVPFKAQPRHLAKDAESTGGGVRDETSGLITFERFCHVYREGELGELAGEIEGLQILEQGWDSGNHYIRLLRTK